MHNSSIFTEPWAAAGSPRDHWDGKPCYLAKATQRNEALLTGMMTAVFPLMLVQCLVPAGCGHSASPQQSRRQALPPALSRVLAASLGCCLVAHLPCSLQRPACLGWTPRPELASAPWTALCLPRSPHSWDAWSLRHCLGPQASCPTAHSCPRPTGFCPLSPGHLRGPGTISIFQHHPFHDL